jgi:hypothetical protein
MYSETYRLHAKISFFEDITMLCNIQDTSFTSISNKHRGADFCVRGWWFLSLLVSSHVLGITTLCMFIILVTYARRPPWPSQMSCDNCNIIT